MSLIAWRPQYSVGVPAFDAQHKQLIQMVNRLYDAMKAGRGQDVLAEILIQLVQYTKRHFAAEEAMFDQIGFAGAAAHKAKHAELTRKVQEFQQKLQSGSAAISVQLTAFLKQWLLEHILQEDKKYSSAAREAPAGAR